ncbi:spermidine synthase, partial [Pseudonocardia yunnanensis]
MSGRAERRERVARAVVDAEVDHGYAQLLGDPDRPQGWTLLLDGTAQSHVDLEDPTHLEFEYVRRLGHVVDLMAPQAMPQRVLHLGGGAWTLARYVATTRPRSPQQVIEVDAALVDLVSSRLPADGLGIDVVVGDARAMLTRAVPGSVDLLVLDVFAGARTPAHLTSTQFLESAAAALAPEGVYAANVADG